ncbi:MAG: hypothetical protein RL758_1884, partial [Pseudomonadota bacterium]
MKPSNPDPSLCPERVNVTLGEELAAWFATAPGQYLLAWEQARFDEAVADLFGYNAVQLGLPQLQALAANRMPHRWLAVPESSGSAVPAGVALV